MTIRSFKQAFSIVVALILGGLFLTFGLNIRSIVPANTNWTVLQVIRDLTDSSLYLQTAAVALGIVGLLLGVIVGPVLSQGIINTGNAIERMSTREKVAIGIGTLLGIVTALPFFVVLLRWPIVGIPTSILLFVAFIYLGIRAMMSMKDELRFIGAPALADEEAERSMEQAKILDTNVIIDGRISDIVETGFLEGPLYVPGFVLDELQHIADSSDSLKRARGRRGLDILNTMQEKFPLVVRAFDHMIPNDRSSDEVDARLVKLARALNGTIVTNDYNLNKVAGLQGVRVLNVNQLANALKPVVLPGEDMTVTIIKEGKEINQGVAYLEDGTMIVVEDGRRHIGESQPVVVTSVLQTVAGKMIFARLRGTEGEEALPNAQESGRGRAGSGPRFKVR